MNLAPLTTINDYTEVYVITGGQIIVALIGAVAVIVGALLAVGAPGRARSRKKQDQIHEQVVNTHSTNMREDIDGLGDRLDGVMERLDKISGDIGTVKKKATATDNRVTALTKRLTNHIDGR